MITEIFKVVSQTEPVYVQSKKQENGQLAKSNVHLKGIGGEYAEEFYAVTFGENATQKLEPGELVAVSLRFGTHVNQDNGAIYQDVVATGIQKLNDVKAF
ncbi:MAG: hypothetical protein J5658_07035 [Prevotella sp.]|nr:hypothetical protein [Prevotella sp.]